MLWRRLRRPFQGLAPGLDRYHPQPRLAKKKMHLPKHTPTGATSSANDREISPDEALAAAFSMDPVVAGFMGLVIFYFPPNKILINMNGLVQSNLQIKIGIKAYQSLSNSIKVFQNTDSTIIFNNPRA